MKTFNTQQNIGKVKYLVNHHDGVKEHKDGSPFFDINTFTNKINFNKFVKKLLKENYQEKTA